MIWIPLPPLMMMISWGYFLFQSGHVRQPIAIWPGNTKSQMKQQGGSCKSHITKSLVKAQEHCSAMTSSLVACLQSQLRQEAVIPISCLRHPGDDGTTEVWRKIMFFSCLDIFFLPRTSESIVTVPTTLSPSWWKEITMAQESHLYECELWPW